MVHVTYLIFLPCWDFSLMVVVVFIESFVLLDMLFVLLVLFLWCLFLCRDQFSVVPVLLDFDTFGMFVFVSFNIL